MVGSAEGALPAPLGAALGAALATARGRHRNLTGARATPRAVTLAAAGRAGRRRRRAARHRCFGGRDTAGRDVLAIAAEAAPSLLATAPARQEDLGGGERPSARGARRRCGWGRASCGAGCGRVRA